MREHMMQTEHRSQVDCSRREMLRTAACGFGYTALTALLNETALAAAPLSARVAHHPARAKRVIFLFMQGGPSQMETFDYKPRLNADHRKPAPFRRDESVEQPGVKTMRLFGSSWKFARHGEAGVYVSELFPEIARVIDEIAVVRSMRKLAPWPRGISAALTSRGLWK